MLVDDKKTIEEQGKYISVLANKNDELLREIKRLKKNKVEINNIIKENQELKTKITLLMFKDENQCIKVRCPKCEKAFYARGY